MKKMISITMIMVLLAAAFTFTGCGNGDSKKEDKKAGKKVVKQEEKKEPVFEEKNYIAVVIGMMDEMQSAEGEFELELTQKDKGVAVMSMDGESLEGTWKEDVGTITFSFEEEGETLEIQCSPYGEDALLCDDLYGMGIEVIFAIKGSDAADPAIYLDAAEEQDEAS